MDGWNDGYTDTRDDDDDDQVDAINESKSSESTVEALLCKHCGSDKLGPRSTDSASVQVQFACAACGKRSTFAAPFGFRKIYVLNQE